MTTLSWPWLNAPLKAVLETSRAQALLVRGMPGVGTLEFALTLAQAWLCESPVSRKPCGQCESCHLVQAHTHPDLHVRLPEDLALALGWPQRYDDKRKPSRQIRMEDIREALDWMVTTPGRGRAKVLVIHPADAMNAVSASALLKTLEEPPALARIVLTAADPSRLLPTILSRCQRWELPTPTQAQAVEWLQAQGVAEATEAEVLLAASSGAPLEALRMSQGGVSAQRWNQIPQALIRGDAAVFDKWPMARVIDALLKVCHDAVMRSLQPQGSVAGGHFFPGWHGQAVPLSALEVWRAQLLRVWRHAEHPWHEPLLLESLVAQAQSALTAKSAASVPIEAV